MEEIDSRIAAFKADVGNADFRAVIERWYYEDGYCAVEEESRIELEKDICTAMDVRAESMTLIGSAKLGFAVAPKFRNGEQVAPPFRPFDANASDMDYAIVDEDLFDSNWIRLVELRYQSVPGSISGAVFDCLGRGWLRPDKLPWSDPFRVRCFDLRGSLRRKHPFLPGGDLPW